MCPVGRDNPFDAESTEHYSDIYAAYDENTEDKSHNLPEFSGGILSDYFNTPFIHVNESSTVDELEDAILSCKHLFLANLDGPLAKRERLLDRLIELRQILQTVKETAVEDFQRNGPSNILQTSSNVPNICFRSISQTSFPVIARSYTHRNTSQQYSFSAGHNFYTIAAIQRLGQLCEHCGNVIRDPTGRITYCKYCGVICHIDTCMRKLTRRCPSSSFMYENQISNFYHPLIVRRKRTESDGDVDSSFTHKSLFRYVNVSNLSFIAANLSQQRWACAECQQPLEPAPDRTVLAEPSMMSTFMQKTNNIVEVGVSLLTLKAVEDSYVKSSSTDIGTPQLRSQVPPLSDYFNRLLSSHSTVFESEQLETSPLQWASSRYHADLGPIQTWADARVVETINRLHRDTYLLSMELENEGLSLEKSDESRQKFSNSRSSVMDQARLCYYSGQYYCAKCHWNDACQIPSCVFILGDYKPKPVCRAALLWLRYSWSRALFRVPNAWYRHDTLARQVCYLRLRIFRIRPYFDNCTEARTIKHKFQRHGPFWVIEQPYTFTMELVNHVVNGKLALRLTDLLNESDRHIESCDVCKALIPNHCAVCEQGPMRPYNPNRALCNKCSRACHRHCLSEPLPESLDEFPLHNIYQNVTCPSDELLEVFYPSLGIPCKLCAT